MIYKVYFRGRHGRDHMVVAISAYHHQRCEFESCSGEVYSIQHYVIKFVCDLQQVSGSASTSGNFIYHTHTLMSTSSSGNFMSYLDIDIYISLLYRVWVVVFNATFNNISFISWRSVLLVEETRVLGENPLTCCKSQTNFIT
jgi:hypothetical protein